MLKSELFHDVDVLKELDGKCEDQYTDGDRNNRQIKKGSNETVEKDHHQHVTYIGPNEIVSDIARDKDFNNKN